MDSKRVIGQFTSEELLAVGVLYFVIGVFGFLSNLRVLLVFVRNRVLTSPKHVLHVNMAIANMLVVAGFPISTASSFSNRWMGGYGGCQAYGVVSLLGGILAVATVTLLCVERYLVMCWSDTYQVVSTKSMWIIVGFCWFYAALWAIFPTMGWSRYTVNVTTVACSLDWHSKDFNHTSYVISLTIATGIFFSIALLSLYLTHTKPTQTTYWSENTPVKEEQVDWFSDRILLLIAGTFLVFLSLGFGPFAYFATWNVYKKNPEVSMLAETIPPIMAKMSTTLYPLAYQLGSSKFRSTFWKPGCVANSKQE
ncbi:hypothetical protein ScPMuIL_004136 [Solemya velum]